MTLLLEFMVGFSFACAAGGQIIFVELMRRSGKGAIWKGLKRFFNGY